MSALGTHLAAAGFRVDDRPVPGRGSPWDGPRWVVLHHYAGSENPADGPREAQYLRAGGSYPPNAHLYVDNQQTVYVICRERPGQVAPGRATHMGSGEYPGIPVNRGNEVCVGIEVQCNGRHRLQTHTQTWPTVVRLMAELLDLYQLPTSHLIGHKEYAGRAQGKIDPLDDMDDVRRQVQNERDRKETAVEYADTVSIENRTIPRGRETTIATLDTRRHKGQAVLLVAQVSMETGGLPFPRWTRARFVRMPQKDGTGEADIYTRAGLMRFVHTHPIIAGDKIDVRLTPRGRGKVKIRYAHCKAVRFG